MCKLKFIIVGLLVFGMGLFGVYVQEDDLLSLIEEELVIELIINVFKSSWVINGYSMEMIGEGVLDFCIFYCFGCVNQGYQQFFGLD